MRDRMYRVLSSLLWGAVTATLLWSSSADAGLLIGTKVTSQTENITDINALITAYNTDFGTNLDLVVTFVDKLEGMSFADFIEGNLTLDEFSFYEQNGAGTRGEDIFDRTLAGPGSEPVAFIDSDLGATAGFDNLDNAVLGFEFTQMGLQGLEFYVSKDGNNGWSLWTYMDGFNPVYTDSEVDGFTRGAVSDDTLAYDPITNGVSHISFYSSSLSVPEPSSFALFAAGAISFGVIVWRRKRKLAS